MNFIERMLNHEIQISIKTFQERDAVFEILKENGIEIYDEDTDIGVWPHLYCPHGKEYVCGCRGALVKNPISAQEFISAFNQTEVDLADWEGLL